MIIDMLWIKVAIAIIGIGALAWQLFQIMRGK
jgi:hypothetical protein